MNLENILHAWKMYEKTTSNKKIEMKLFYKSQKLHLTRVLIKMITEQ